MNNSFSIAIWCLIVFVLFTFSQRSDLVASGITHLPQKHSTSNTSNSCAGAQQVEDGFQPPLSERGPCIVRGDFLEDEAAQCPLPGTLRATGSWVDLAEESGSLAPQECSSQDAHSQEQNRPTVRIRKEFTAE